MPSRWVKPVFGVVVTCAFAWLLLHYVDVAGLTAAFANLSAPWLLLALAFLAAGYVVRIIRWWWMLRALEPDLDLSACIWPFLTSIAVLAFFFVGLLGLPQGAFPETFVTIAVWLAGGSLGGVMTLILLAPWLPNLVRTLADRPAFAARGWSDAIHRLGINLVEALGVLGAARRLVALLGLSLLTWAFEGAVFATVAIAFDTGATPIGPWFALATATLATLLPSSPGYVGTFDYFAVLGLAAYGASQAAALAFALTVHAVLWVPLTALGLGHLLLRGERIWRSPASASLSTEE
jgi:uncharacterized membrane protein YbhN (UPF0104 family)